MVRFTLLQPFSTCLCHLTTVLQVLLGIIVDYVRDFLLWYEEIASRLVANQHILILGWSDKIPYLLTELSHLYQSTATTVVIMSSEESVEMEKSLLLLRRMGIIQTYSSWFWSNFGLGAPSLQVAVRQGDHTRMDDLLAVSALSAKDIMVIGNDDTPNESDQLVIRTMLCIEGLYSQTKAELRDETGDSSADFSLGKVFAEIKVKDNTEVVRRITGTASRSAITSREVITKMLADTCVEPGRTAVVYRMLTPDKPDQLTFSALPHLVGQKIGSVCDDRIIILGKVNELLRADGSVAKRWSIPDDDYEIAADDQILYLFCRKWSRDDSSKQVRFSAENMHDEFALGHIPEPLHCDGTVLPSMKQLPVLSTEQLMPMRNPGLQNPRVIVILGWAADVFDLLESFNGLLPAGSEIHILSDGEHYYNNSTPTHNTCV